MPTGDYEAYLIDSLRDPVEAACYLTACFEEGPEIFLMGLRDLVKARGGLGRLAKKSDLNRENLYRLLSRRGNPRLSSLGAVLKAVGLEVEFKPAGR